MSVVRRDPEAPQAVPGPLSAVMPALRLAQEENGGWLSPDAIREVADALELTPAYCLSIASFYDQYRLEPVGRRVSRCARTSPARSRAQQVVEAFERELGVSAGSTREDGAFTLGTIECLGGCGWATVVAIDNRHRLRVQADDVPGSSRSCAVPEHPQIVFAGTDGGAVLDIDDYERAGGFSALRKARAMAPDDVIAELEASGLRGRGGAFFPTGRKWAFVPKPDQLPKPHYLVVNADESEPGTFKDREIMLRVPFRFLEGCLIAAHGIQSQHVFVYIRGEYEHEFEVLRDSLEAMRKADLLGGVTVVLHRGAGRLHLRRGDRAPRVARGQARTAADEAAVPGDRRPLRRADRGEQRRVDHDGDVGARAGRRPSTRSSASRTRPGRASSRSRATS